MKILFGLNFVILSCVSFSESSKTVNKYDGSSFTDIHDSFETLNNELKIINRNLAQYAWDLSINPNGDLFSESLTINSRKNSWQNKWCNRLKQYERFQSENQQRMRQLFCSGPKFTEYQSNELSKVLYTMENIFTTTQICLPVHLDLCRNLDHIWDYTYVKTPGNGVEILQMKSVQPRSLPKNKTNLKYFDGNISGEYVSSVSAIDGHRITDIETNIRHGPLFCLDGEPDLDRIMGGDFTTLKREDCSLRFNEIVRWAWEAWRIAVGIKIGSTYPLAVHILNIGAQNNGYHDIGVIWRNEMEDKRLEIVIEDLLKSVQPFYRLLHGIYRNVLWKKVHAFDYFDKTGTIPAHLLGSMWAQDWSSYQDLIMPYPEVDLDVNLNSKNWTNRDMVKRVDDYYSSLGLPAMRKEFWTKSIFDKDNSTTNCHGTAANMYAKGDYRMIVCSKKTFYDFYVIVHEMGHIQYYTAYESQPTIFQDANTAIQESIGDAIYLAMMTPQHLNRIRLLPDKYLYAEKLGKLSTAYIQMVHAHMPDYLSHEFMKFSSNYNMETSNDLPNITVFGNIYPNITDRIGRMQNYFNFKERLDRSINSFDLSLLLKMALEKIPNIPFEYILDVFRWRLFDGTVSFPDANTYFWRLIVQEQGIHPPDWLDRREFFDAGAKFHVADNTPFVRYFLASFLEAQIFRGLCEVTVFGHVRSKDPLPMPLHRCDIYGSKRAGKLLQSALKLGNSKHWSEILFILTGYRTISADALLQYYEPLSRWLEKIAIELEVPIGW